MNKINLGGDWQVCQVGASDSIPAVVPGCVHTDLLAVGKIEDPFYRDNEDRLQWIGEAEWVYARSFTVPEEVLAAGRVVLRCDGLDTLATVAINGQVVGSADNMFRVWEFDVKNALVAGENTIEVRFGSAISYISERQAQRPLPGWGGAKEIGGRAYLRKQPCNFGWDWGPTLVTCGIWRNIELIAFSGARLTDVAIQQDHGADGAVTLTIAVAAEKLGDTPVTAKVSVSLAGGVVADGEMPLGCCGESDLTLSIPDPQLWWPVNMGAQPLYDVAVTLVDASGQELDATTKRIGLRTLRLDRHPDEWGESFQFVVNGVPYFAKGANWIPADAFATRISDAQYRDLLESTADANMNMLRVWGGGIYEQDVFYELCDELGITIWQDFMFACSTYPSFDDAFMANVRAEVEDNVRRLRHHPCIAFWNGNNELEQGLVGDEWNGGQMSWEDYGKLFDQLIPEVCQALDPQRDYWPSSPHTPEGGDRRDFNDPTRGDAHLWDVWHGRKPFEWYRTCEHRFNSEFGFQSFPEPKTVNGYTAPTDRNVTTYVMEHHQRSGIGNAVIMQYMLDWFRLPTSFDMNLWLSQVLQGMAMKYAVEHWRRAMPRGMGTLYWQLNDCWPVASWASIDFHGRWKALQFMAKKFNAPILVSGVEDWNTGEVELHVTCDLLQPLAAELRWSLLTVNGDTLDNGSVSISTPVNANILVERLHLGPQLAAHGARNLILFLDLLVDGESVSSNLVTFARPKHLELPDPGLTATVAAGAGPDFAVTLAAEKPALWAWLEVEGVEVRFSDSFVHLLPGRPVTITVTPCETATLAQIEQNLRVRSLIDTYA